MNTESQVLNVPIEDIIPNRFQPRISFDEEGLQELADSIKEHGIIQPLVLRRLEDKYEIIAGERRYKAAKVAGLTSVPAIIAKLNDNESAEVAIVENVQRRNLSAIEEAKSYKALLDKGYLTQEELAKKMGLSQSAISNKLRLLSLSEKVQNALMEGKISERHARSLLRINNLEKQDEWLDRIIKERLTVRSLDKKMREDMNNENNVAVEVPQTEPVVETPSPVVPTPVEPTIENNDDIPVIPSVSTIDEIKNKATDLFRKEKEEPSPLSNALNTGEKVPNKFFNFLEDEEANMSVSENTTPIPQVNDEVEMLDFLAPEPSPIPTDAPVMPQVNERFNNANNMIDELINNLNNSGYKANVFKDESSDRVKYTINVE